MNQVSGYGLTKDGKNQYPMPSIQSKMNTTRQFRALLLCALPIAGLASKVIQKSDLLGYHALKNAVSRPR